MSAFNRFVWQFALLASSISATALASTIYVDAAAPGAHDGTSWTDAFTNIQAAVSSAGFSATSDATILVKGGTYNEWVTLTSDDSGVSGAPNRIQAYNGETVVVNSGVTTTNGITLSGASYLSIEGITVRNAKASGILLRLNSQYCTLSNVVVSGSSAHGIWLQSSPNNALYRCVVTNNTSYGINLYAANYTRVEDSLVGRNGNNGLYAGPNNSSAGSDYVILCRSQFLRNTSSGIYLQRDSRSDNWLVTGCLAYGNYMSGLYKGAWNSGMILTNSILAANHEYDLFPDADYGTGVRVTYTCLYASRFHYVPGIKHFIDGGHNLWADPGFVAPWANDFRLYEGAPAAGAGGGGKDMGPYPDGPRVALPSRETYYVRTDGHDGNSGLANTPGDAFRTIQKAATVVTPGDTIRVQAGTYAAGATIVAGGSGDEWSTFVADGAVAVTNASGPVLSLQGTHRVALTGFTVTAGNGNGVELNEAQGCRFTNCALTGSKLAGAYLMRSHEAEFTRCDIDDNKVNGVLIYLSGEALFDRCRIYGNTGSGIYNGKYGGGSLNGGAWCTLRNSLLWLNTVWGFSTARDSNSNYWTIENSGFDSNGGGIYFGYKGGAGVMIRSTLATFNTGSGIQRDGDALTLLNNDVYGNGANYAGTYTVTPINSLSVDPLYTDRPGRDYQLESGSLCLNTGTNQTWMATAVDFAGQPRIAGGVVDMGAYERAATPAAMLIMVR